MPNYKIVTGLSTDPRVRFRQEISALIGKKGLTHKELADALGFERSHISGLLSGRSIGGPDAARAMDTYFGTSGKLLMLWELAKERPDVSQFKERYQEYMRLEAEARRLQHHAVRVLPGLLQSPAYARAVMELGFPGAPLEEAVSARVERREILHGDDPPELRCLIPEAVITTPVLPPADWSDQLTLLLELTEHTSVTVQLVPMTAGLTALPNTDVMLLTDPNGITHAWVETDYGGQLASDMPSVLKLQKLYDRVRDVAWSPTQSREFIRSTLGDAPWTG